MKIYEIKCEKYYNGYFSDEGFVKFVKKVESAMQQMISHLEIKNKQVLSIGAGRGHEEYWFYKNGCQLTFIDIDEGKTIESYIKTIEKAENPNSQKLTYILGDARDIIEFLEKKYDICYFSSLTPDEIYRRDIQDEYRKLLQKMNFISCIIRSILLKLHLAGRSWPKYRNPFSNLVMNISRNALKDGGLFILQSYYGGINTKENPQFIKLVKKQLAYIGISLLYIFSFKDYRKISLTIGYKGNKKTTRETFRKILKNPKITSFHGRAEVASDIIITMYQFKK